MGNYTYKIGLWYAKDTRNKRVPNLKETLKKRYLSLWQHDDEEFSEKRGL